MPRKALIDAPGALHHIIPRSMKGGGYLKTVPTVKIFWHGKVRNLGDTLRPNIIVRTYLKNNLSAHGGVAKWFRMLTYYVYAPLFHPFAPCPEL